MVRMSALECQIELRIDATNASIGSVLNRPKSIKQKQRESALCEVTITFSDDIEKVKVYKMQPPRHLYLSLRTCRLQQSRI